MKLRGALSLFGPAWIIMMADVDASSVITAVSNGEIYGYGLVYFLLLLIIPLFIIQDAMGRIGAAAPGYGFGDLIRMQFSGRTAMLSSFPMFATDMFTYVVEYAGIGTGALLIGIPLYISLPTIFIIHLAILMLREYGRIEKPLILASFLLPIAFLGELVLRGGSGIDGISSFFHFSSTHSYIFFLSANVGAVVMPFMLFYQSSATSYKYARMHTGIEAGVRWSRRETIVAAFFSELIMVVIEMGSTGLDINDNVMNPGGIASALESIAGPYSPLFFGIGLILAGFIALVAISLGSSWGTLESIGKYSHRNMVMLYVAESVPALIITLTVSGFRSIVGLVLELMSVSPLILILPGIMGGLIVTDRKIMGKYAYGIKAATAYWITLAVMIFFGVLSLIP
ncbi:MAG: divalent metal cation transporter [Candidatus Thermoplasmatota archaeon]|jgi:Mn2+/Fe2+ NRAMP family transporter|nr:divalent metal cation transporter [Candidatus Thermoplasmatota archaeon]MCL5790593.1 divalent metal cation transporter [Candidatus Thermoplasmatota archaeon]